MTKEQVIKLMSSSRSEQEWNANCDTVKRASEGDYPDWWYVEIILSGLARRVMGTWTAESLKVTK